MFSNASNFVEGVDTAFVVILGICFFFLIAITFTLVYFLYKYNKKRHPKAVQIKGSNTLEIIWTVIPTILVLVMFYYGWVGWKPMKEAPEDSLEVKSVARMWSWMFEYPNGKVTDTLYVPKNQAVKLDLVSMDVLHSLYIPAFRIKQDMVPGKKDLMWFISENEGTYDLFCTEYCGLRHSYMATAVVVMPEEDFEEWYVDTTATAPAAEETAGAAGQMVLRNNGCFACHSVDGSRLVGPTFKGVYNHEVVVIENGEEKTVVADDDYIIQSIYEPNVQIVKGYNKGLMQSYEGLIPEDQMQAIIEYLKTLED